MKLCLSPVVVLATALLGCAGTAPETGEESSDLSTSKLSYVSLRLDLRKCAYPLCGGYFARDLNGNGVETYVWMIDYSKSRLGTRDIAVVKNAPIEQVVIRGRIGLPISSAWPVPALIVHDAFVGMPGITPSTADAFYVAHDIVPPKLCVVAPCNNAIATAVNTDQTTEFTRYSMTNAAAPMVDLEWLTTRVENHDAVVAAHFQKGEHFPGGYETILTASQVYVKIPEHAGPCANVRRPICAVGNVPTYVRTEDRCEVFDECVTPTMCPMILPRCNDGYTLEAWPAAPGGCNAYACDAFR